MLNRRAIDPWDESSTRATEVTALVVDPWRSTNTQATVELEVTMNRVPARAITHGAMIVILVAFSAGRQYQPEAGADLLLVNGKVYTLTWGEPSPEGEIADGTVVFEGW